VVIRIHKLKDRQHNGQKKKYKGANNDLQNIHIKLKIGKYKLQIKPDVNSCAPEGFYSTRGTHRGNLFITYVIICISHE